MPHESNNKIAYMTAVLEFLLHPSNGHFWAMGVDSPGFRQKSNPKKDLCTETHPPI